MCMTRTHVEPRNVEVLLELAEVGATVKLRMHELLEEKGGMYSDKRNPELNMSFAKMVPKGLRVISASMKKEKNEMEVPRDVGVRFDHLFGSSLEKDLAACGASCFQIDYGSYAGHGLEKARGRSGRNKR
jgi:hypothetical protein